MGQTPSSLTSIEAGGMYVDVKLDNALNIALFAYVLPCFFIMAISEYVNFHIPYSKFAQDEFIQELPSGFIKRMFASQIDSRNGMFFIYILPFLGYVIIWGAFAGENTAKFNHVAPSPLYSILLFVGWFIAFGKRLLEVLFLHVYSGTIPVASSSAIGMGYTSAGLITCVFANQVAGYDAFGPQTVVKDSLCVIFFIIGITVNFISHYQLRQARLQPSEQGKPKRYLAPAEIGWLFKVFICPHYVFEIVMFAAWSIFGATCVHYCVGVGVFGYLSGRTRSTYKWYQKKGLLGNNPSGAVANDAPSDLSPIATPNPLYTSKETNDV